MGIRYNYPEGSTLKGRRSTRDPLSPENLGKAEPSEEIVFTFADLLRLYKSPVKSRDTLNRRKADVVERKGIQVYDWYTWRGYKVDDAADILYDMARKDKFKRVDPEGAYGKLVMARHDLNDSIPFSVAARILGFGVPEFKVNGKYHNGEKLDLPLHPRQRMYPWIKRALVDRAKIKEMLESGDYPGFISYDGAVD